VIETVLGVAPPEGDRDGLEYERAHQMWLMPTAARTGALISTNFMKCAVVAAVVLVAFVAAALYCGARAWAGRLMPYQLLNATGQDYYQHCFTIIDLPWQDLEEAIPELQGLVHARSQQQLLPILSEVGKSVEESYKQFTKVVADEEVTRERCDGGGRFKRISRRQFSYMIVSRLQAGQERIDEYRADVNGKVVQFSEANGLSAEGFAGMWAILLPGNQSGSKFRYLGRQQLGGHVANVIGFAQRPGYANYLGFVDLGGHRLLIMEQGVVWIDRNTNEILKLRADLLKPRLEVGLELQTTEIQFGEVHVSDAAAPPLSVPLRVTLMTVLNGRVFREVHLYSNYKLPTATFKIGPATEGTASPPKTN
jgi:hypothetical protein